MHIKILKSLRRLRPYLTVIGGYLLYLTVLPVAIKWITPCLNYRPGVSYAYAECHSTLILDRFLIMAMVGYGMTVLFIFFTRLKGRLLHLAGFAATVATLTVGAYYLYVPVAMAAAANAPILLESLR